MNTKWTSLALIAALGLAVAPAFSADNGFYLGAGVVKSEVTVESEELDELDGDKVIDDESFKVIAGFRPLDWLAFEVNYIDLGSNEESGVEFDANAIGAFVLGLYEVKLVDFYAKVGMVQWKAHASQLDIDEDSNSLAYGVGIGVHFGSVAVRAEYEQFEMDEVDLPLDLGQVAFDSKLISVAFTYTFL